MAFLENVEHILDSDLDEAAAIAESVARINAPVRTGRLRRGIRGRRRGRRAVVSSEAPYTKFVEEGTIYIRGRRFMKAGLDAALAFLRSRGYR